MTDEASGFAVHGEMRLKDGEIEEGIVMYRAAWALDPSQPVYAARLAVALAENGQCEEAQAAMEEAAGARQEERHFLTQYDEDYLLYAQQVIATTCGATKE